MNKDKLKEVADQVFRDMAGAMTAGMVYVGTRTGLFRAMQGKGPLTTAEVTKLSGMQPRYVEEWLKGMASAGYLRYENEKFELSEEHAYLLASEGTDHFVGGMFEMVPPLMRVAPQVAQAFAKGGGVPFADFGPDCVGALDLINRGQYEQRFAGYWLKSLPEVVAKLSAGGRVLDVGCGSGRVCATLAREFPKTEVVGVDPDEASIRRAQASGSKATFMVGTASDAKGTYDLVTLCDCLHDLPEPVKTLRDVKKLLKPDGTLFIVEPKAADRLEENLHPVATMFYGFSIFHCMTQSLANHGPGLGTCMGPAQTEKLAKEAGFARFEVLPIKSQVSSFYAVKP